MDALQPPRPLDKTRTAFDTAHISSLWLKEPPPPLQPFLLLLFVLFITVLVILFSFGTHGNIKEPFVPAQCCGQRAIVIFLIPSCQTEVTSAPRTLFNFPAAPPSAQSHHEKGRRVDK